MGTIVPIPTFLKIRNGAARLSGFTGSGNVGHGPFAVGVLFTLQFVDQIATVTAIATPIEPALGIAVLAIECFTAFLEAANVVTVLDCGTGSIARMQACCYEKKEKAECRHLKQGNLETLGIPFCVHYWFGEISDSLQEFWSKTVVGKGFCLVL